MNSLLSALGLLTALPLRPRDDPKLADEPGKAMWAYPVAGVVIGFVLAGLAYLLRVVGLAATGLLAPALLLATWCALTGALHLDGWADCCDALWVPATRERRLEILHDPRLGSFGGVGLSLLLILKVAAIQAILPAVATSGSWRTLWPLLLAPASARWCMVVSAVAFPLARPDGMAAYFRRGAGPRQVAGGAVVVALVTVVAGWPGLASWGIGLLAALGLARLAAARLGGLTGDVYGATVELVEMAVLVTAALLRVAGMG